MIERGYQMERRKSAVVGDECCESEARVRDTKDADPIQRPGSVGSYDCLQG